MEERIYRVLNPFSGAHDSLNLDTINVIRLNKEYIDVQNGNETTSMQVDFRIEYVELPLKSEVDITAVTSYMNQEIVSNPQSIDIRTFALEKITAVRNDFTIDHLKSISDMKIAAVKNLKDKLGQLTHKEGSDLNGTKSRKL